MAHVARPGDYLLFDGLSGAMQDAHNMNIFLIFIFWVLVAVFFTTIRQVNQYQRGVKFMFGRFHRLVQPGWRIVIPVIQSMSRVDIRTKAVDVPDQEGITKDNISCRINAVIYYRVVDAAKAVLEVENFWHAVSQLAQTTMRNVVGQLTLDELLSQRDEASTRIKDIIAKDADDWGLEILNVELKDIQLPEDMKRTIAKQAEAERERRAVIIHSEGEVAAASNLHKAAEILSSTPGALHLRTLNSLNDISSDQSNTIVFAIPLEVLRAFEALSKK
jgi:regulator of protease activity HflC (stomatin/prohibitin superfamily)